MARILLVDDEPEWQKSLRGALPAHKVTTAGSYEEALERLEDAPYEVAIVDLNLLGSHLKDNLGTVLLELLHSDHPATRRIGLTGSPLSTVKKLFVQYDLDDLLLKAEANLAEIRDVVNASAERAYTDVARDIWVARAELWEEAASWKRDYLAYLDRAEARRNQELRDAESAGRSGEPVRYALTTLQATSKKLQADTKTFFSTLSKARSDEDVKGMSAVFRRLRDDFSAGQA